jgi:hypothetical protein
MKINWKLKIDAPDQTSSEGDWYALTDGGYIHPEEVLADEDQLKKLIEATNIVKSFFDTLRQKGLIRET